MYFKENIQNFVLLFEFSSKFDEYSYFVFFQDDYSLLATAETLFLDGTFRSCPDGYEQVFVISTRISNEDCTKSIAMPLALCLMRERTKEDYKHVFDTIEKIIGQKMAPEQVVSDFEMAILSSVRDHFG